MAGSTPTLGVLNDQENSDKGCLRRAYAKRNIETVIEMEKSRLLVLTECLLRKRPVQSLRVSGLRGLNIVNSRRLLQEIETKATLLAIEEKKKNIKSLHQKLMNNMRNPSYILSVDERAVNMHQKKMNRKIDFLRKCDETKWKGWNKKNISETTLQKYEKLKSNRKKRRKVMRGV